MKGETLSYFLATNSGQGFFSLFDSLYDAHDGWNLYIIKGGPGTGKSGIMKKVFNKAVDSGYNCHAVYCSSDPNSLDAVIIPEIKVSVCDGTSPHTVDPKYPGVSETIINLGECWDEKLLLESKEHIITLTDCNKALHKRSSKYLSAASKAQTENEKILNACINYQKAENYAIRNISKSLNSNNHLGNEKKIFINGYTPQGRYIFTDTINTLCDKIVTVTDEYTQVSSILMKSIGNIAKANGSDVILCLDPLRPTSNPLHVIIPKLRIGYFTSDSRINLRLYSTKNINATRFIDKDKLSAYKNRISFNLKTAVKLENEAINIIKKAKSVHDELEKYYIHAMDFDKLNDITDVLIKKIFSSP